VTVVVPLATIVCEMSKAVASMVASPNERLVTFSLTAAGRAKGAPGDVEALAETRRSFFDAETTIRTIAGRSSPGVALTVTSTVSRRSWQPPPPALTVVQTARPSAMRAAADPRRANRLGCFRRRKGPWKAPGVTPSELFNVRAGPAKLDLPEIGFGT
jgi:hypothetical protein